MRNFLKTLTFLLTLFVLSASLFSCIKKEEEKDLDTILKEKEEQQSDEPEDDRNVACDNHKMEEILDEKFLKSEADCTSPALYYLSCRSCGMKSTDRTFEDGEKLAHNFTLEEATAEYLKTAATCTQKAVYYKSCDFCGEKGSETFTVGDLLAHDFSARVQKNEYRVGDSTTQYYFSCTGCGLSAKESGGKYFEVATSSGLVFAILSDTTCALNGYGTCKDKDVVVPTSWESGGVVRKVTKVSNLQYSMIESITVPDTVTVIKEDAFKECSKLKTVILAKSVTEIEEEAFSGCSSLESVDAPGLVTIGKGAFKECSELKTVTVGSSLETIGAEAFSGCESLTSFPLNGSSLETIGAEAFSDCESLTSISIGRNVTTIGEKAFARCTGISSIAVATRNTKFSDEGGALYTADEKTLLFYPAKSDEEEVRLSDSVVTIRPYAFYAAENIRSIVVPKTLKTVGESAFGGCSALGKVYYKGNSSGWNAITIGSGNDKLKNANRYYYSESDYPETDGYWNFDKNNEVKILSKHTTHTYHQKTVVSDALKTGATCESPAVYYYSCVCGTVGTDATFTSGSAAGHDFCNYAAKNEFLVNGKLYYVSCKNCTEKDTTKVFDSGIWLLFEKTGDAECEVSLCSGKTPDAVDIAIPDTCGQWSVTSIADRAFKDCTKVQTLEIGKNISNIGTGAFEGANNLATIFYRGSEGEWNEISGKGIAESAATVLYYSETEPESNPEKYWFGIHLLWANF